VYTLNQRQAADQFKQWSFLAQCKLPGQVPPPHAGAGEHGAEPQAVSGVPLPTAWAEISLESLSLPQTGHCTVSDFRMTRVSNSLLHASQ
jgi:hypothetical protein